MDKPIQKPKNNGFFYSMVALSVGGIFSSAYYLFSLYNDETKEKQRAKAHITRKTEKLRQEQEIQDKYSNFQKQTIQNEIDLLNHFNITKERSIQIFAEINKEVEALIFDYLPKTDEIRRSFLNNEKEYLRISHDQLVMRHSCYVQASEKILRSYQIDPLEFQKLVPSMPVYEYEKYLFEIYKPYFKGEIPPRNIVKEAFLNYAKNYIYELEQIKRHASINNLAEDVLNSEIFIIRNTIEDEIYCKYGVNELQIRYLIFDYDMINSDREVKRLYDEMNRHT